MSNQHNIKWIGSKSIDKLQSPFKTVAQCKGNEVKNVIIALHGFGDTAANFASLANEIKVNDVLWIFPQGPRNYPMGIDGAQWFPLFNNPTEERRVSEDFILQLIYNVTEQTSVPLNKIFILGFSQGASMALNCGLKGKEKISGIISLSGFMIQAHVIKNSYAGEKITTPVFIAHGLQDQVVLPAMYFESVDLLKDMGTVKLRSKTYQMGHSICQEELNDISKFIEEFR
ncbi:alpha/beta hydrolase [Fluviispira multicolorata]|uniref:Phospholipase/carboxylesterase/thioesterase domain-containing protein n=1 Tax=Fluviispira multicolorata TaxID=2654512 RepID=A0A833JDD5_9BACT|nr:hypothetical protein [Fluviispira multicolorata]KAB8031850.1 hypothetical protein GCL57_04190 [Fluviispira multicolorata]